MRPAGQSTGPTSLLAEWSVSLPRSRTQAVAIEAAKSIKDLLGCLIGGTGEQTPRDVAGLAATFGSGPCTILGHSDKVSAPWAALANASAAHILDFDDSFRPMTGHPSCTIIPAILAVAEEFNKSGADVFDAYVVGIEIAASLGRAEPQHHHVGWHGTATVGVISSAVALARLLGFDVDKTIHAMSIAVSSSSGSRMQIGHPVKCIQPGFAAHDAVVAAYMARIGIKGNTEVLIGPYGFSGLYCNNPKQIAERYTVPGNGDPLAIADPGITFKPYPTCGSTHRTLAALFHLCTIHKIRADDIQSVQTTIPFLNTQNLRYNIPSNGMQARFSMPYTAALAIVNKRIRLGDFDDEAVNNPRLRAFAEKVSMHTLPGSENSHLGFLEMPCYTAITLHDGTLYEDTRYHRPGEHSQPWSTQQEREKFQDCVSKVMNAARAQKIWGLIDDLARAESVVPLLEAMNVVT